jgi:hypothetical protein
MTPKRVVAVGLIAASSLVSCAAFAAQPPDVVVSDANGNTAMGTDALLNNSGSNNTAAGLRALQSNTLSDGLTAFGFEALRFNTTGGANAALGYQALSTNTTGSWNTADGHQALLFNTAGDGNTATGYQALIMNTTGNYNTALGQATLSANTIGNDNTAVGSAALFPNTTGNGNTATASAALTNNTTGSYNTANGFASLNNNTEGSYNTALGVNALQGNIVGVANSAVGFGALGNATGGGNVALGVLAGNQLTTGDNNIYIGNPGRESESGVIRIGTPSTHQKVFVQGVWGTPVRRSAEVVVDSNGQLGIEVSSERYKTDVLPMETPTDKVRQLRPVTFHVRADAAGERRYGLIAEEVDKVYPELVVKDEDGRVESVRYAELAPILLKEIQQQQDTIDSQHEDLVRLKSQYESLRDDIAKLRASTSVKAE